VTFRPCSDNTTLCLQSLRATMTDTEIDLLLLQHLDPHHESFRRTPVRQVSVRLSLLVHDGSLVYYGPSPISGNNAAGPQGGYLRTATGEQRLMELINSTGE
jgi:hypothetical protein